METLLFVQSSSQMELAFQLCDSAEFAAAVDFNVSSQNPGESCRRQPPTVDTHPTTAHQHQLNVSKTVIKYTMPSTIYSPPVKTPPACPRDSRLPKTSFISSSKCHQPRGIEDHPILPAANTREKRPRIQGEQDNVQGLTPLSTTQNRKNPPFPMQKRKTTKPEPASQTTPTIGLRVFLTKFPYPYPPLPSLPIHVVCNSSLRPESSRPIRQIVIFAETSKRPKK